MASFDRGILDGVIGKVGTVVGYKMNGVHYLRAHTAHIKKAKTVKQLAERSKMGATMKLGKSLLTTLIHPVWKRNGKLSGINRFVQANLHAFESDGSVSDPSKLLFSEGGLLVPEGLTVASMPGTTGKIALTWTPKVVAGAASADDVLKIVTWNNGVAAVLDGVTDTRGAGTANMVLPFAAGTKVSLFAFFGDKNGENYSKSVMVPVTLS